MRSRIVTWQILGFVFTGIIGVLLHFLYDLSGNNVIVALFSAVNESIWEHMKLLFFPMLIFSLVENKYIDSEYKNFWCVKLIGSVLGIVMIPVSYYTINGVFGKTPDWVNIAIFFVTNVFVYFIETILLTRCCMNCKITKKVLIILFGIALSFVILTFVPPHIPLFEDPITNTYGFFGK